MNSQKNLRLGVVILGAGASTRMGRPKMLLPWGSMTVLGHIVRQWRELGACQIAVVGRPNDDELMKALKRVPCSVLRRTASPAGSGNTEHATRRPSMQHSNASAYQVPTHYIVNPQPERGMFSSVLCAASWDGWKKGLKAWAIVLGDQPHLSPDTLRALLACHRKHPDAICQPIYEGRTRHPVLLPRAAFDELKRSREATLKEFLKHSYGRLVKSPIEDPGLALDLDRPEDYEKAIRFHLRDV